MPDGFLLTGSKKEQTASKAKLLSGASPSNQK
jgi:hypothetical protein